jgi:hypothetical protein
MGKTPTQSGKSNSADETTYSIAFIGFQRGRDLGCGALYLAILMLARSENYVLDYFDSTTANVLYTCSLFSRRLDFSTLRPHKLSSQLYLQ